MSAKNIRKIAPGAVVTTYAGGHKVFQGPQKVACDGAGNLFVADANTWDDPTKTEGSGWVTVVTAAGVVGSLPLAGSDGHVMQWPEGVAVDAAGNVYVADFAESVIGVETFKTSVPRAITALPGAHGTITPGTGTVAYGSSPVYDINPDPGYYTSSVTVDGVVQPVTATYQFLEVKGPHTIERPDTQGTPTAAEPRRASTTRGAWPATARATSMSPT